MDNYDKIAFNIFVSGRVQGVAFRHFTKEEAKKLHLFGSVKNLSNGQVEIFVEGAKEKVMAFLSWCHRGPSSAHVDKLEYEEIKPTGLTQFTIIR